MGLAAIGGKNRVKEQPWIPLALAAKAGADALQAAKLTYDQCLLTRPRRLSEPLDPCGELLHLAHASDRSAFASATRGA